MRNVSELPDTSCIYFQLRGVPVKVNVTKSRESYLNVRVGDDLRLLFGSCDQSITCVIYKNNEPSTTLATDSRDSNRIIMHAYHDSIRCSGPNGVFVKFHIFSQESEKFFKKAIIKENAQNLTLGCLGGIYTTDVKLVENDKELDVAYDPLLGFTLDKTKHPRSHFYQCQYQDERICFDHPNLMNRNGFGMRTIKYLTSMMVQCEADQNFIKSSNTSVMLACPNRKHCPVPTIGTTPGSTNLFSAQVQMKNETDSNSYKCVFMRNGKIESIASDRSEQTQIHNLVVQVLKIVAIITVILWLLKVYYWPKEKKKKDNKFDEESLIEDSKRLGDGHSSEILLTKHKLNGNEIVIKCLKNPSQCQKELYFFKKARHVNIIDPLGYLYMTEKNTFFNRPIKSLVLPYYQNFCLEKFIRQFHPVNRINDVFYGKKYDEKKPNESKEITITLFDMVSMGWQIATALEHLKRKKITHRDVAMRNVLVTDSLVCKLTDFERAKKGETEKISVVKKLIYSIRSKKKTVPTMYPEECVGGAYYYSTEVYCFGLLLLEMFQFVKSSNPKRDQPMHCPSNIYDLITDCIKSDRRQRIEIGKCESELRFATRQLNEDKFAELESRLNDGGGDSFNTVKPGDGEDSDYRELDYDLFN